MVGFYVFGGGMGHLSRVKKFIAYEGITNFKIFTGNPVALRFFDSKYIVLFKQTENDIKNNLTSFLIENLSSHYFDDFYVDCFPAGILYELQNGLINSKRIHYITRRIKENSYQYNLVTLNFDTCVTFENLEKEQLSFVINQRMELQTMELPVPKPSLQMIPEQISSYLEKPIWLIVHSSNPDEVELLILKANQLAYSESKKPQLVLISDNNCSSENVYWIKNEMSPTNYFPIADIIITGGGFNIIHELKEYRHKHVCLAFERKYDNQQWRIKTTE